MSAENTNKIVIRRLNSLDDVNNNREAIEGFFAESRFAKYELSWARVENLAKAALSAPDKMMILLAERLSKTGQQLIGFAMCSIGGYVAVVGLKLCQIQFLHVLPEFRKGFVGGKAMIGLLRGVEKWAKAQGAKDISLDLQMRDVTPGLEKLLGKMNYREHTRGFVR